MFKQQLTTMNNQDNDSETYCRLPSRICSRMQDNLLLLMFLAVMTVVAGLD
jgi:hypothetical protein